MDCSTAQTFRIIISIRHLIALEHTINDITGHASSVEDQRSTIILCGKTILEGQSVKQDISLFGEPNLGFSATVKDGRIGLGISCFKACAFRTCRVAAIDTEISTIYLRDKRIRY